MLMITGFPAFAVSDESLRQQAKAMVLEKLEVLCSCVFCCMKRLEVFLVPEHFVRLFPPRRTICQYPFEHPGGDVEYHRCNKLSLIGFNRLVQHVSHLCFAGELWTEKVFARWLQVCS